MGSVFVIIPLYFQNDNDGEIMIRKLAKVVITFYTTTDAMAMESLCKAQALSGRMIPVPGEITADCGLAWCAEPQMEKSLLHAMKTAGISYQGIYNLMV